jgi:autotransporter-associated beta strand protein
MLARRCSNVCSGFVAVVKSFCLERFQNNPPSAAFITHQKNHRLVKPKKSIRSAIFLLASTAAFSQISYSQTLEVDPVAPIPETHTSKFATEWDTPGDPESWIANAQYTLAIGTPTDGQLTGTQVAAQNDPNLTRSGLSILGSSDTIIEFRITKDPLDTSRIDLFWADDSGGIGGPRIISVPPASVPADGLPHTYRFTFSGQISGKINTFRLDPSADTIGRSKATSIDYIRVYTTIAPLVPLTWDPAASAGATPGGAGTWDTISNFWWDGTSQLAWPAPPAGDEAIFSGATAGAVNLVTPVTAKYLTFGTTGYSLTGTEPLTLMEPGVLRNTVGTHITTIDVPLAGSGTQTYTTGTFVIKKAGIQTGTTRLLNPTTGITLDNPFGASTNKLIWGAGGNVNLTALGSGSERVLANNIDFVTNRLITGSADLGTGLPVLSYNLTGNVFLNMPTPGDIFLRRPLKISGIVSGTGFTAGLYFAGDANTMTLTNTANTFTKGIRWDNGSILEVASDGSMGAAANNLRFNLGTTGTLRLLSAFDSARPIVIANNQASTPVDPITLVGPAGQNNTTARIDTNGFDSTWTGIISAPVFVAPATAQQNTNFTKIGAGTLTLDSGGTTANNLRSGGIRVDGGTLKIASGAITTGSATANGVAGGCFLEVNGGSLTSGNFAVGKSAGIGTLTLNTGGTINNGLELLVGFAGDGVFTVNGGLANLNNLSLTNAEPFTSTINLNGGEVRLLFFNARANAVTPATATINFNGSLIQGKGDRTDFIETNTTTIITANVQAGGAIIDSNGFALTINQPLVHDAALGATLDGGLTKNGLGTLTLNATNTYTGPTTVNAGVLAVNGNSIPNSGKLDITSGQVLIPAETNEVVSTLFYNGVEQPPGVYGSVASGATNQSDTFFEPTGTGTLTVVGEGGGGSTYADWLAANSPATGFDTDTDNDGIPNGVENVLGTNPNTSNAGLTQVSATANSVTFQHTLNPTLASDVSYVYQWSSDLVEWVASGQPNSAGTIGTIVPSAPESGVVTVTTTTSGTASAKMFTRIKADNP